MVARIDRGDGGRGFPAGGAVTGRLRFLEMGLGGCNGVDDLLALGYHRFDLLRGVVPSGNGFLDPWCQVGRPGRLRRDAVPCRFDHQFLFIILCAGVEPTPAGRVVTDHTFEVAIQAFHCEMGARGTAGLNRRNDW